MPPKTPNLVSPSTKTSKDKEASNLKVTEREAVRVVITTAAFFSLTTAAVSATALSLCNLFLLYTSR